MKDHLTLVLLFALACLTLGNPYKNSANASDEPGSDFDITIDAHEDTPQRFLDENYDVGSTDPRDTDFISLDKARAGHLNAVFFSIWADPARFKGRFAKRTLDLIDSVYAQAARHPGRMTMCFSVDDIRRARERGRFAALLGIEGGHSIENDLSILRDFYRLGARYMTLTWNNTNDWADSSGDAESSDVVHHNGLTDFGRQVVLEMNRIGMMVDVSHVSDKTFWDVLAVTKAPIIASHSSSRSLVDIPRNLTDDMLRAVAHNGGVVNVAFAGSFVDDGFNREAFAQHQRMLAAVEEHNAARRAASLLASPEETQRFEVEWLGKNKIPRPALKSLIDHIDHVARVAGIEHVGLGSDSDGVDFLPAGMDSCADLPKIRQALLDRNYSSDDVNKIMGGNMLRVLLAVERASREIRTPVASR
jgi:membrane dipeptidase